MFEKATRLKLRFGTTKGNVTLEDLWDLPLVSECGASLDDIAKSLNKVVKAGEEESFVVEKNEKNKILELKFEIVKHVISIRLDEKAIGEKVVENKLKKEKLINILSRKEDEALESKDPDEIREMIEKL